MNTAHDLEVEALRLPPAERERLARKMWESLVTDPGAASNSEIDEAGLELAAERDSELDSGQSEAIDSHEFRRRTGGGE